MKIVNLSLLSLFFLVGFKQADAQATRKVAVEHKELTPVKEPEVKEAPHAEAIAPQPVQQHAEFVPAKEPEVRNETHTEIIAPPTTPIEEHKAEPVEKVEWVKTEPEPVKPAPAVNTNSQNAVQSKPVSKLPVFKGEMRPAMKRATIKPFVIDSTKK